MLQEAFQIAILGVQVYQQLFDIAASLGEKIEQLTAKVNSQNALISWIEFGNLVQEFNAYSLKLLREFQFDMREILQSTDLLPHVKSPHAKSIEQSEPWQQMLTKQNNLMFELGMHNNERRYYKYKEALNHLINDKFQEEDDVIASAAEQFISNLFLKGIKFRGNCEISSFARWLKNKIMLLGLTTVQDDANDTQYPWQTDLLISNKLVQPYVDKGTSKRQEWCLINDCDRRILNLIEESYRGITVSEITLNAGLNMQDVYEELKAKVERDIQVELQETFKWLMIQ